MWSSVTLLPKSRRFGLVWLLEVLMEPSRSFKVAATCLWLIKGGHFDKNGKAVERHDLISSHLAPVQLEGANTLENVMLQAPEATETPRAKPQVRTR